MPRARRLAGGGPEIFSAAPSVEYRVHPANRFFGRRRDTEADNYAHWLRRDGLVAVFAQELGLRRRIVSRAEVEFRTIPHPTRTEYEDYVAVVRESGLPVWRRLKMRAHLYRHLRNSTRSPGTAVRPRASPVPAS